MGAIDALFRRKTEPERSDKPLYLIVSVRSVCTPEVRKEIDRIRAKEDVYYVNSDKLLKRLPRSISKKRKILVCGCFYELCVAIQEHELDKRGYNVKRYEPACQRAFVPEVIQRWVERITSK